MCWCYFFLLSNIIFSFILLLNLDLNIKVRNSLLSWLTNPRQDKFVFINIFLFFFPFAIIILSIFFLIINICILIEITHDLVAISWYNLIFYRIFIVSFRKLDLWIYIYCLNIKYFSFYNISLMILNFSNDWSFSITSTISNNIIDLFLFSARERIEIEIEHLCEGITILSTIYELEIG